MVIAIKGNFNKGDRVKRKGYNAAGSVIVLPLGKVDHWSNYEIFIEQQLTIVNK